VVDQGELFEQIVAFYESGEVPVTDARPRVRRAILVTVESPCRLCHRLTISASLRTRSGLRGGPITQPFRTVHRRRRRRRHLRQRAGARALPVNDALRAC
jgi:hypothetical protein